MINNGSLYSHWFAVLGLGLIKLDIIKKYDNKSSKVLDINSCNDRMIDTQDKNV